jgi:hypothetical protein
MSAFKDDKPANPDRQEKRYAHLRDLSVAYEGHSMDIPLRSPDISSRGMFVNTAHEFPQGAVLKVSFRLPWTNYKVTARCEVRYCLPGVGVGLEFVEISEAARRAIEDELQIMETSTAPKP